MNPRNAVLAAVLLTALAVPARAQDPAPTPEPSSPAPAVVERVRVDRAERSGNIRAPRDEAGAAVRTQEAQPRSRVALDAAAPAPAAPAFAEEQGGRRRPSGGGGGGQGRGGGSAGGAGGAQPRGGVRAPSGRGSGSGGQDMSGGEAVPRTRAPRSGNGGYYYPSGNARRYYAVGGLGYYLYDPWSWYAGYGWPGYAAYGWGGYYGNRWGGYGGYGGWGGGYGAYGGPYGWSTGGVRMKVDARDAEVYVDGYYAGIVDDFDGTWQQLRLDEGGYRIEVRKPGMETLTFDVMIQPGRTITYRGHMTATP